MSIELEDAIKTIEDVGNEVKNFKTTTDEQIVAISAKTDKDLGLLTARLETRLLAITEGHEVLQGDLSDIRALVGAINDRPTAKKSNLFEYIGHATLGILNLKNPSEKSRDWLRANNAMREGTTSTGGATVPEEFIPELIDLLEEYGVFRSFVRKVPMATDLQKWPKKESGVTVIAPGEGGTITPSDLAFSNVTLVATKLAALTKISSELHEDSALALGSIIGDDMVRALAKAEDQAGFLGDGSATYFKFVGLVGAMSNNTITDTDSAITGGQVQAAGHTWPDITIGNLRSLAGVMPVKFQAEARFYCSKIFYWTVLVPLVQAAGGLTQADMEGGIHHRLFGWPVEIVEVMPTATAVSQFCLWFADLKSGAFFGDRRDFNIQQDSSVYFDSDQIAIRSTERFAINVYGVGSTTKAGPICALKTAND